MLDLDRRTGSSPIAKAPPSRLSAEQTVDEAIGFILENCLYQVTANRAAAEDGQDPEGVHQMRVGLRRLRAALQLLRKALPGAGFEVFETEAEALTDALGPVRNLDSLDARLAVLRKDGAIEKPHHRALQAAIATRRADLLPSLRAALRSERSRSFLEGLAAWIADRGWRSKLPERDLGRLARPSRRLARRALDRLERKARRRGRRFRRLDARRRHKYRIATKKLRYAVKFFAPLFDGTRRYQSRLGKLQDALGEDHDAVVTPGLLDDLARHAAAPEVDYAVAAFLAAQKDRRPALRKALRKRRRQWKKAEPFW
ncbi:MAG TPA: CHAD domain-containing protein [Dongiaceae bacterium]|nr:CHAD domain-containing protein [Dongiaceae bacterium]